MENKKYDLESMQKDLFRVTKNIEFELLSFIPSSQIELKTLPHIKEENSKYTATFYCRQKEDCFFYKVIFTVDNLRVLEDMKSLFKRLEVGARTKFQSKNKTKNPFKYLNEINIYPIESPNSD